MIASLKNVFLAPFHYIISLNNQQKTILAFAIVIIAGLAASLISFQRINKPVMPVPKPENKHKRVIDTFKATIPTATPKELKRESPKIEPQKAPTPPEPPLTPSPQPIMPSTPLAISILPTTPIEFSAQPPDDLPSPIPTPNKLLTPLRKSESRSGMAPSPLLPSPSSVFSTLPPSPASPEKFVGVRRFPRPNATSPFIPKPSPAPAPKIVSPLPTVQENLVLHLPAEAVSTYDSNVEYIACFEQRVQFYENIFGQIEKLFTAQGDSPVNPQNATDASKIVAQALDQCSTKELPFAYACAKLDRALRNFGKELGDQRTDAKLVLDIIKIEREKCKKSSKEWDADLKELVRIVETIMEKGAFFILGGRLAAQAALKKTSDLFVFRPTSSGYRFLALSKSKIMNSQRVYKDSRIEIKEGVLHIEDKEDNPYGATENTTLAMELSKKVPGIKFLTAFQLSEHEDELIFWKPNSQNWNALIAKLKPANSSSLAVTKALWPMSTQFEVLRRDTDKKKYIALFEAIDAAGNEATTKIEFFDQKINAIATQMMACSVNDEFHLLFVLAELDSKIRALKKADAVFDHQGIASILDRAITLAGMPKDEWAPQVHMTLQVINLLIARRMFVRFNLTATQEYLKNFTVLDGGIVATTLRACGLPDPIINIIHEYEMWGQFRPTGQGFDKLAFTCVNLTDSALGFENLLFHIKENKLEISQDGKENNKNNVILAGLSESLDGAGLLKDV